MQTVGLSYLESSMDPTGNRTWDLLSCCAMPQPTVLLLAPSSYVMTEILTHCDIAVFSQNSPVNIHLKF
jgi:hypothetical protein